MNFVPAQFEQLPSAYTTAQVETHARQQSNGDIPGFVIACAGTNHAAVQAEFAQIMTQHSWVPFKNSQLSAVHAIGYGYDRSGPLRTALVDSDMSAESVTTVDKGAHFDGTMQPSYATSVLGIVLQGEILVEAFQFTDHFTQAYYRDHSGEHEETLRTKIRSALHTYETSQEIDQRIFKPIVQLATVRPGQAISLTIKGPHQVPHRFTSTKLPRLSGVYDFDRAMPPAEMLQLD